MCTAIRIGSFAGRNLDIDKDYGGEIIVTPRNYQLTFKHSEGIGQHYAIIGMGAVNNAYPLYFDALNEYGLYATGLNYVGNAKYHSARDGKINLAPYELIPYILSKCATTSEAKRELEEINLIGVPFSPTLNTAELHFFIADKESSIVVESDADNLHIYDNPADVLTNNPPFPVQLLNLSKYMGLSASAPKNTFSPSLKLEKYSHGMGAIGLPGDLSSDSRFVRAVFHRANNRGAGLATLFHILSSVAMPDGSVKTDSGFERTEYSIGADLVNLIYSYRHYDGLSTHAVKMSDTDIDGSILVTYGIVKDSAPIFQGASR